MNAIPAYQDAAPAPSVSDVTKVLNKMLEHAQPGTERIEVEMAIEAFGELLAAIEEATPLLCQQAPYTWQERLPIQSRVVAAIAAVHGQYS